jgi:hypothetical protein
MAIMQRSKIYRWKSLGYSKLEDTINEMCLQIPGFFFGRMDVMYNSFEIRK